jgi:hypothetical protein
MAERARREPPVPAQARAGGSWSGESALRSAEVEQTFERTVAEGRGRLR